MKIGTIQASQGERAFGFFSIGVTHGRFPIHIPLHLLVGAQDGPTLVVQAGASGMEIEPALILPHVANELDPAQMKGALILAPLMNTSAFEFEQVNSAWDGKHYNRVGRGDPAGSVSERLVHSYYQAAIAEADALLDIRTGALSSYHEFVGVYSEGAVDKSRDLAVALGLPHVLLDRSADGSIAHEAASDGKASVVAHIGGGPGLRDYRDQNLGRMRNAVRNAMRHLGMLGGAMESDVDNVSVIRQHTVLTSSDVRGFTFIDKDKRGTQVQAGDKIGYVRHPFSGKRLADILAPRAGIMARGGAAWPVPEQGTVLAILGDLVEEIAIA